MRRFPRESFEHERDIQVGSRKLELRFLGPGHTADNIVVWIPETRILFGGDLVRSASARSLGYTEEADLGAWPSSLEVLARRYGGAALIVPGHGRPGGAELLAHTSSCSAPRAQPGNCARLAASGGDAWPKTTPRRAPTRSFWSACGGRTARRGGRSRP